MTKGKGRPKSLEKGVRLHIIIPETLSARLDELQAETCAASTAELIRKALTLYVAALDEHKNGGRIYFRREGETMERQLLLFI